MGNYTTDDFMDLFGGLPERGDRNWAGPELDLDDHDPCPMGCGSTTEDPYGGPCKACWALTDASSEKQAPS